MERQTDRKPERKRYLVALIVLAIGGFACARLASSLTDDSWMQAVIVFVGVLLFGVFGQWLAARFGSEQPDDVAIECSKALT